jgi:GGDEF domain-containing protein
MSVQDDIGRPDKNEGFLIDPLTGFGSRHKLLADLTGALEPGSVPSVLAVFDLAGASDYRRVFGEKASDELIARLAEQFARLVQPTGVCYRPRQDEFCALVSRPIGDVSTMLVAVEDALKDDGRSSIITPRFGAAFLPDETTDPIEALMLAGERLRARTARERRQGTRPV